MTADIEQLVQARKAAEAAELATRLDLLQAQAGSSMVTSALISGTWGSSLRHCWPLQARKAAEAVELAMRLDRLDAQAGSSMVTTNTLASMDEDENDTALKRFNIILKVRSMLKTPHQQLLHALRVLSLPWVCEPR